MLPGHHLIRPTVKIQPRRRRIKQPLVIQLPPNDRIEVFPPREPHHDDVPAHEQMQGEIAQPAKDQWFRQRHRQRRDGPPIIPLPRRTILNLRTDGERLPRAGLVCPRDAAARVRAAVGVQGEQDLLCRRAGQEDREDGLEARALARGAVEGHLREGGRDDEDARMRVQRLVALRVLGDVLREGVEPGAQEDEVGCRVSSLLGRGGLEEVGGGSQTLEALEGRWDGFDGHYLGCELAVG